MRGKTVVITGGTSGIGEVAAVTLARMGARIVLIARDKTRADATLARLRDTPPENRLNLPVIALNPIGGSVILILFDDAERPFQPGGVTGEARRKT
jgi:NAD(P)-dependent dehydrogenase (short-subunit alcohol dehydrogenase family)